MTAPVRPGAFMKDRMDKSVGKVLLLAARLHTARRAERLAMQGLFPGQEIALQALASRGPLSMSELAGVLQVKPPTVSKMVSRLSAQGFVERSDMGVDARQVHVSLTQQGKEVAKSLAGQWQEVEDDMLARLDAKERKLLRKLLRRVVKSLAKTVDDEEGGEDDEEPATLGA